MRTRFALGCLAVGVTAAVAAPVPWQLRNPELLVNGSFEDGPEVGTIRSLDVGSTDIKGWTVTRQPIDYVGQFWTHHDGKRSIDLHGSPGLGGLSQTIKTTPGLRYTLSFYLSSTPWCAVPKKKMAVGIDGDETTFTCDSTGLGAMKWERQSVTFTATGKATTIEFYTLETEDPNCGPAIDDVSVKRAK